MIDSTQIAHRKRLGEMMKAARTNTKPGGVLFSGARMAKLVGVSKDMIERYENGRTTPPLERLLKYCGALVERGLSKEEADKIILFGYPFAKGMATSGSITPVPSSLTLLTQKVNPQWADFREYSVGATLPWALRCRISTASPYFRFGFKLLAREGRVVGDGSIQSFDENLLVHIGRNNWDRPALGITSQDIFVTGYMSGSSIEENDRFLFRSKRQVNLSVELMVDSSYRANLTVNGDLVFQHIVAPALCHRVVVYAWGDREEFRVDITDLAISSI